MGARSSGEALIPSGHFDDSDSLPTHFCFPLSARHIHGYQALTSNGWPGEHDSDSIFILFRNI